MKAHRDFEPRNPFGAPPVDTPRTWISHRASRLRAYGQPAGLVCAGCGCLLADGAHSPRCQDDAA